MNCPYCSGRTTIIETRKINHGIEVRRRRMCIKCGFRFTTYEKAEEHEYALKLWKKEHEQC